MGGGGRPCAPPPGSWHTPRQRPAPPSGRFCAILCLVWEARGGDPRVLVLCQPLGVVGTWGGGGCSRTGTPGSHSWVHRVWDWKG